MKKLKFIVTLIVALLGLQSLIKAQGPVRKYNDAIYSVEEQKKFAMGSSDTSKAFAEFVIQECQKEMTEKGYKVALTRQHLGWIFDSCMAIEEIKLKAGEFENSGWSRKTKNLDFFLSKYDFEGMAGVFKYGRCYRPLWKGNCSNGLKILKPTPTISPFIKDVVKQEKVDTPKVETKKPQTEEYIPDPTPYVASPKPEAKKMEMGDRVEPDFVRKDWSRPVDGYYPPQQKTTFWDFLRGIWVNVRISGNGNGQTFYPIHNGERHDPQVLGGGNGRHDPQLLFF